MSSSNSSSLPTIELVSLFFETLIFGTFAVLYSIAVWLLVGRRNRRSPRAGASLWMSGTSTVMFVLAVTHLICDVQRAVEGLILQDRVSNGPEEFYGKLSNPTQVGKSVLYVMQTLVGDTFVIYRLHVIWNRSILIVILPILLLLGTCVTGLVACQHTAQIEGLGVIFAETLAPWITSFFVLSLTTNILATALISGRIAWSNHNLRKYGAGSAVGVAYWGVVEIIIQSASIYTCVLILLLGTYLAGSNIQYIFRDALQPTIGFVFTLIIIRVHLRDTMTSSSREITTVRGPARSNATPEQGQDHRLYPMRPLAINISVSQTHDQPSFEGYPCKDHHAQKGFSALENEQELPDVESTLH